MGYGKMLKQFSNIPLSLMPALFILGMLLASPALADPLLDPPPQTAQEDELILKYAALLQEDRYAELDKEINQLQKDFEEGKRDDVNLMHLFRTFSNPDPALEEKLNAWNAAFPKSYAALEARALYYELRGYTARGYNTISQTSNQQLGSMEYYLKKAMADEDLAMGRTAKPVLSYFNIMRIAKLVGDRPMAEKMLKMTVAVDPKNFIARYKYMLTLETRWGGSLQEMKEFRKQLQNAGLTSKQMFYLDERISDEINYLAQQPH